MQSSSSTLDLVGSTPAWDPCESSCSLSDLSPAWDPSSRSPIPPSHSFENLDSGLSNLQTNPASKSLPPSPPHPVHWLDNPALRNSRLKLQVNDPSLQSPCVEFLGVENNLVKVRDKRDTKSVAFQSVSPLLPTSKGDLVMPKTGKLQGTRFTVIRIAEDQCILRKPGCRPTKENPDSEFSISDLVQVYPAPRRL